MRGIRVSEEKSVSERRPNRKKNDPFNSQEIKSITLRAPELVKQMNLMLLKFISQMYYFLLGCIDSQLISGS